MKGDLLGIVQEIEIDHTTKWYIHKSESARENEIHKMLWDFDIQKDHLILFRRLDTVWIWNRIKKRICVWRIFVLPVDYRMKVKESEK